MEARDLGNTISLYLPQAGGGQTPFAVLQERKEVRRFQTPDDARTFALELAGTLHERDNVPVRLRIEQEDGHWETVDVFLSAVTPPRRPP